MALGSLSLSSAGLSCLLGSGDAHSFASLCSHIFQLGWEDLSESDGTITELGIGANGEFELPKAQVR